MEEIVQVGIWIGGGFFLIISGLLTWIGANQREIKRMGVIKNLEQDKRLDHHDERFEEHQNEIHELALQNRETLTIIKHKLKMK